MPACGAYGRDGCGGHGFFWRNAAHSGARLMPALPDPGGTAHLGVVRRAPRLPLSPGLRLAAARPGPLGFVGPGGEGVASPRGPALGLRRLRGPGNRRLCRSRERRGASGALRGLGRRLGRGDRRLARVLARTHRPFCGRGSRGAPAANRRRVAGRVRRPSPARICRSRLRHRGGCGGRLLRRDDVRPGPPRAPQRGRTGENPKRLPCRDRGPRRPPSCAAPGASYCAWHFSR